MSDLRTRLARASKRVHAREDALERLERRRDRRELNRRIEAGVLAMLVAVAGIGGVVYAFRGTRPGHRSAGEAGMNDRTGMIFLWPDQTLQESEVAQRAAGQETPTGAWQTRPREVAGRFAADVLGWHPSSVEVIGDGPARTARLLGPAAPRGFVGIWIQNTQLLTLRQPETVGTAGIWEVTAAQGSIVPGAQPGQEVRAGDVLRATAGGIHDGTRFFAGITYDWCGGVDLAMETVVRKGALRFTAGSDLSSYQTGPVQPTTGPCEAGRYYASSMEPPPGEALNAYLWFARGEWPPAGPSLWATLHLDRASADLSHPIVIDELTAVPISYVPFPTSPSPQPTAYEVSLPEHPVTSYDSSGHLVMDVPTNLPDGTKGIGIWSQLHGTGTYSVSGPSDPTTNGHLSVRVTRACGAWPFELDITPEWIHSEPYGYTPPPFQPPSVYALLGKNFEKLTGPQVVKQYRFKEIVAKSSYFLATVAGCKIPASNTLPVITDPGAPIPGAPSGYGIAMPYSPQVKSGEALFPTNLPDGTSVAAFVQEKKKGGLEITASSTGATVSSGEVEVPVPALCGRFTLQLAAAPTFPDLIHPTGRVIRSKELYQLQSVYAALGNDFRTLSGPQVRAFGTGKMLLASHTYFVNATPGCHSPASGPQPTILSP